MEDKQKNWLFRVFFTLSLVWAVVVFWLLFDDQYYNCSSAMKLNEVGDFLAGSFSPLAFFWLAYGYWMQNKELKNQITEFKESVRISNENLSFQKLIYEKSREEEKKSLQPILRVKSVEKNKENPSKIITIEIKNIGQEILDIEIEEDSHIKQIRDQSIWRQFETKEININYNETEIPEFDINDHDDPRYLIKKIYIYFTDKRNNRYKISLEVYCIVYTENSFYAELDGFGNTLWFKDVDFGY